MIYAFCGDRANKNGRGEQIEHYSFIVVLTWYWSRTPCLACTLVLYLCNCLKDYLPFILINSVAYRTISVCKNSYECWEKGIYLNNLLPQAMYEFVACIVVCIRKLIQVIFEKPRLHYCKVICYMNTTVVCIVLF